MTWPEAIVKIVEVVIGGIVALGVIIVLIRVM